MNLILTLDPSSTNLGVCIGDFDGNVLFTGTAKTRQKSWGKRLEELQTQVIDFILPYEDNIHTIVFENNTFSPAPLWMSVAMVSLLLPDADIGQHTGIFNGTWKALYRKKTGDIGNKSPKGRAALAKWDATITTDSDDSADATMIFKTFIDRMK